MYLRVIIPTMTITCMIQNIVGISTLIGSFYFIFFLIRNQIMATLRKRKNIKVMLGSQKVPRKEKKM